MPHQKHPCRQPAPFLLTLALLLAALLPAALCAGDEPGLPTASAAPRLKTVIVDHYYPYTFVNDQGHLDGFSVELIRAAAGAVGLDLDIRVDSWQQAQTELAAGAIDFLPMMAFSEEREQTFDFSPPHTIAFDAIFVRKGSPPIKSLAGLKGKKIIVMRGDRAHEYLQTVDFIQSDQLVFSNDLEQTLKMLDAGHSDAALLPKLVGLALIDKIGLKNLEVDPFFIDDYRRPFSIAVKNGNFELLERLNQGVSILKEGKRYQDIYYKWFGRYEPPQIAFTVFLRYFLGAFLVLATLGVTLLLWNFVLRRQVARRTAKLLLEIEDRKRVEAALAKSGSELAESHALLKAVLDGATDAIFVKDLRGRYLLANQATCLAIGKPEAEVLGRSDNELFAADSAAVIKAVDASVLESGAAKLAEERLLTAYGDTDWLTSKFPLRDHSGAISGLIGISRNITALKTAEKSWRDSEERFRRAITYAPFPIMIHDSAGQVLLLSNAWTELSGYTLSDIPTIADWTAKAHGAMQEEVRRHISALFHLQGRQAEGEYLICAKDGRELAWDFSSAPLGEASDGRELVISMAVDVTDRKKAAQERKEFEVRLRQAEKMEAIGTLAGGIAHDFNNILSVILGYTELAKDDAPADSPVGRDLQNVLIAAHRARDLVRQILAFSRQRSVESLPFQPASIVKEAVKLLRASIPTTIDIQLDVDPAGSIIVADPTQFNQILMNLCTNAYHAMEQGGGVLSVSLRDRDLHQNDLLEELEVGPGRFVELGVGDTGPGIDPLIRPRIFDPYFTTKEFGKGTGMGLAIVHGIVKGYGGLIKVDSTVGVGTVFKVYFPAEAQAALPGEAVAGPISQGTERILLVDDEEFLVDMGTHTLTRLGYQVATSHDGAEALATFKKAPDQFDLIITDQTMPKMTGAELASRVLEIRPDQRIILCTGHSSSLSEAQAKAIGIREFALKPLVKQDLARLIRKVLDAPGSAALPLLGGL